MLSQCKAPAASCPDAECAQLLPAEGVWWGHSHCLGCVLPLQQNKLWLLFAFYPFEVKGKILLGFLLVSKNSY